jgi:leader peptidase (prepilin peptidase) / N-methyltransferase
MRSRRPRSETNRPNWPLLLVLLGFGAVSCGYVFVWPYAAMPSPSRLPGREELFLSQPAYPELVLARLSEFLIGVWVLAVGASIGSFLNVVVYRLPRGATLLGTSHCPKCGHAIRPYDNVPVFGWLALRGRCRDCALPISPRYPLVEAIAGATFFGLALVEVFSHGANLPGGFSAATDRSQLLALTAYHGVLLCSLLSWALIVLDRQALPKRFVTLVVGWGLAVPAAWPAVHPVSWAPMASRWLAETTWRARFDTSLVGLLAGGAMGWLLVKVRSPRNRDLAGRPEQRDGTLAAVATAGLYLGWQAAISVLLLAAAARLLTRLVVCGWEPRDVSASTEVRAWDSLLIWIFPATVLQICLWQFIDRWPW